MRKLRISLDFYRQMVPITGWMIGITFGLGLITRSEELAGLLYFLQFVLLFFSLFAVTWGQRRKIYYYRNLGVSNGWIAAAVLVVLIGSLLIVGRWPC